MAEIDGITEISKKPYYPLKFSDKLGRISSRKFVKFLTNTIKVYFLGGNDKWQ